jgi:DNA-binding MarR family transcriptional regulator
VPALQDHTPDHVDRLLEQWAAVRPDLDASPVAVIGRLFRASRFVEAELAATFAPFGINRGEFDVLASLFRAGAPHRLTPTALSEALLLSNGAMTNRVDRLETAGLVARRADPADRRGVLVELTRRGRAVVERLVVATIGTEVELLSGLTPRQRATLAALLKRLLQSMGRS